MLECLNPDACSPANRSTTLASFQVLGVGGPGAVADWGACRYGSFGVRRGHANINRTSSRTNFAYAKAGITPKQGMSHAQRPLPIYTIL